jgi:hypothetical protein
MFSPERLMLSVFMTPWMKPRTSVESSEGLFGDERFGSSRRFGFR